MRELTMKFENFILVNQIIGCLLIKILFVNCTAKLQELFNWNVLDYDYASPEERYRALLTEEYVPQNNMPIGIEVWRDKLFVTVPRWRKGVPSTLNYIPINEAIDSSPHLIPYPNWNFNKAGDCTNGLTTVFRIKVDECDRLWVLDSGTLGIFNATTYPCPFALNVFDLHTNKRLRRYELRKEDINRNTLISTIAVDVGKTCEDTFAYMSDQMGYGLVVYSWEQHRSWRFSHGFFMPDPLAGDFNIGGLNFQWFVEGVLAMALSPIQEDGSRVLFFGPLASHREFAVSTAILRNSSKVGNSYRDFIALEDRGPDTHITAKIMDQHGLEFFSLIDLNAIGCWHSMLPYKKEYLSIVDKDDEKLIFPSDLRIDMHQNLWVMSDRMPIFIHSTLNVSDYNFRVFYAPVEELIRGTACDVVFS